MRPSMFVHCGKGAIVIFDTDVMIWYFRGHAKASRAIESAESRTISVVTYMELLQGARDKREQILIRETLSALGFQTLPLSENVSHRAAIYMEEFALIAALCPMDALIAATSIEHALTLTTGNRKHFSVIKDLSTKWFKP